MSEKPMLVKYVLDNKNQKVGTIIAYNSPTDENSVRVGFSLCSRKHDDFIKSVGKEIAKSRAEKWKTFSEYQIIGPANNCDALSRSDAKEHGASLETVFIDQSIRKELVKFISRCSKYFKGRSLPNWAETFYNRHSM